MLSKRLWVWPLLGAVALGAVGTWVRNRVEGVTHAELASRLQTLLNAETAALRLWYSEQELDAKSFAADVRIQGAIVELAALTRGSNWDATALIDSVPAHTLGLYLQPLLQAQHYLDYVVVSPDRRILASPRPHLVGRLAPEDYGTFLDKALAGESAISRPFAEEASPTQQTRSATMFVAAPVRSSDGTVAAVLGLRMKPEVEFNEIFSVARTGATGESYAFDRRGLMLTASRFNKELRNAGLIPDTPQSTAILHLRLTDPGRELTRAGSPSNLMPVAGDGGGPSPGGGPPGSGQPTATSQELPLTWMARAATLGRNGADVIGYRNYLGVEVVGAWVWLPEYGMGVATEMAAQEAFQTLYVLRRAFLALFLLLVFSGAAIFAFTILVERLQSSIRLNALAARRLGQYVLVQEIGRGANGLVYRAQHALLRRPVAVKLLSPELTNETTVANFEHEAQMTSQLTHSNTVAIYDYGRTPEGLFYYAMEYLSGINLHQLVRKFGPQPEGRVIHILLQVCGSLVEAHRIGLIHRDIKPANIVLTQRGGVCDVVKVLDFGLVKARQPWRSHVADRDAVVGTPHFMPPEAIEKPENVDARSDLYSVGAVGYWLLTGRTLFDSDDVDGLLKEQVNTIPPPPSERLGRQISADLERLILRCLSKAAEQRPRDASELEHALKQCASAGTWTVRDAQLWWEANMAGIQAVPQAATAEKTLIVASRG